MKIFSNSEIKNMDYIYRINLINSCSGFKSANLIATKSNKGITNVAVFSSVTHLGSNPPLLGFVLRPTTVPRNTYENIKKTGKYTINHITENIVEDAHHTSAKYDKTISEFDVTNLEEDYKNNFFAPYIKNAPVQIGMEFLEEIKIKANGTILIIGKIETLHVDEHIVSDDGFINLSKGKVSAINGLDAYTTPKLYKRLDYQRPKEIHLTQ